MANRADTPASRDISGSDEIDVLFGAANPNPERVGCLPRDVLSALARRERPLGDPAYEHLAGCSPCYLEFRAIQQAALADGRRSPSTRWWLAAAVVLVGLAIGALMYFRAPGILNTPVQPPTVAVARALLLDLRPFAVARSERSSDTMPPLALSAERLDLTIQLPVGSEPGKYDVRLLDAGSRSLAAASGNGEIRDFVTIVNVALDLRNVPLADYRLAVRREAEEWAFYPAIVK